MADEGWLRQGLIGSITVVLIGALGLILALALGWNSPRPTRPPDWQAPGLPLDLEAPAQETFLELLNHPGGDFTLEVEATPLYGPESGFNGYGLVYRAQDTTHYYTFAVGSDGYYSILRIANGDEAALVEWQQFPHVHRHREANRLRVTCAGAICHFYINDEYTIAVEDDAWLDGDVGLWVRSYGDEPVGIRFLSARMWTE
jgi:hypothetical protein